MSVDDARMRDQAPPAAASDKGFNTGTDGNVPQPIDQALLGGAAQRVGRFEYRYDTDTWTWSDTVARIHGYEPGTVEPTTEMVLSHKHPDDLAQVQGLLKRTAAPFSSRHRILTVSGDTRTVVVVGEAVPDQDGQVVATRGFYIDVTEVANAELQETLGHELRTIVAHREIIEQAKGMLMAIYDLNADAAFQVLKWRSQEHNVKLNKVAEKLVAELPNLLQTTPGTRAPVDHYLMTLQEGTSAD